MWVLGKVGIKMTQSSFNKGYVDEKVLKLCEVVYNILKGVIPLTKRQKQDLGSKKRVLRKLVHPKLTVPQRRRILTNQQGGILPILPLLAPLLGAVASPILKSIL